jgi:Ca2+-binding RTX toxin-like protein
MHSPSWIGVAVALVSATLVTLPLGPASAAPQKATATFKGGVLTIKGTGRNELITVVRRGNTVRVTVNGTKVPIGPTYKNDTSDGIRVKGRGGNDRITVDLVGRTLPPLVLDGGPGNDTVTGTSSDDVLRGGPGADVLSPGPGGSDVLDGSIGPDTYLVDAAQTGHARIIEKYEAPGDLVSFAPTAASRWVEYSLGTDAHQLIGTYDVEDDLGGIESVTGGAGDDYLATGRGDDVVRGGPGDDHLFGSYQDDHDVLSGDDGDDVFSIYCVDSSVTRIDTITDFVPGTETVDLSSGLSVKDGLGTSSVTIWDGVNACEVVEASNGHLWQVGDFT